MRRLTLLFERLKMSPSTKFQQGFSLVGTLIAVAIVGILAAGLTSLMTMSLRQQAQSNLTFQIDQIRKNLTATLNNSSAWSATVNGNSSPAGSGLDCIKNSTPCTANGSDLGSGGAPLSDVAINKVFDSSGSLVLDLTSSGSGFTPRGETCSNFDSTPGAGNDSCPLRFNLTWSAICNSSCVNPGVRLSLVPQYNPSSTTRFPFNPANYSSVFFQGSLSNLCGWSFNGTHLTETCATYVGIGTQTPGALLDVQASNTYFAGINVQNSGGVNSVFAGLGITNYTNGPGVGGINFHEARGTASAPLPVQTGDQLGAVAAWGWNGSNWSSGSSVPSSSIAFIATGVYSPVNVPSSIIFSTTPPTSSGQLERMRISESGNIGIGTSSPGYKLDVAGGGVNSSNGYTQNSDVRLKTDISRLTGSLLKLRGLHGVTYRWVDQAKLGPGKFLGFIAQEVETLFPEAVRTGNDGIKSVNYSSLLAPTVEAVNELAASQTDDRRALIDLTKKLEQAESKIKKLSERLDAMQSVFCRSFSEDKSCKALESER